ncbi:uncharacterized protein PV06_04371 [Exophiala oligosperma]|uniref:Mtf2-like C-terminal domain-containing protein n=2 Tax=Chaetothyriales TaxID=34395 RepID=A0A0D2DLE5_9EURO|nr:uncharacterized protein PV06_04371 [Exophiala oligosperma]KAJ9622211.1 hypothetical protein H2204_011559 [Knufia peltigerae]KIW43250.1 hypothetical protein PV06_04371 [Exophiala oligosperma]
MADRTGLPFLYQTRTILCRPLRLHRPSQRRLLSEFPKVFVDGKQESRIPLSPPPGEESYLQQRGRQASKSSTNKLPEFLGSSVNSTITASERRAFETILRFTPDESRSGPVGVKDQTPQDDALDTDIESILDIFATSVRGYNAARDARLAAARDPDQQHGHDQDEGLDLSESKVGRTTRQQPGDSDVVPLDEQSFQQIADSRRFEGFNEPIKAAVRKCMTEISSALQAAATSPSERGDIAMWRVCESQIFSLAAYLRPKAVKRQRYVGPLRFTFSRAESDDAPRALEAAEREFNAAQEAAAGPSVSSAETLQRRSHDQSLSDDETQNLVSQSILHHVYPAALLLALRLYIRHFPSSHLPHNLLPSIRSFGHTSYVLGASTQFYNSLMYLVWSTRSSLREIDSLLSEMEGGGVELNEETYRLLRQIEDERAEDLELDEKEDAGSLLGSRGGPWWRRHEQMFWFPRILHWLGVISKRLNTAAIEGRPT